MLFNCFNKAFVVVEVYVRFEIELLLWFGL